MGWPTMTSSWCWRTLTWRSRWGFRLFERKGIGKIWKNWKILASYATGLHVRHIKDWCRTWLFLKDKQKDSKINFQELGSYINFLQLGDFRNCGFLLGWWADTIGMGPPTGRGFNVVPGTLKHSLAAQRDDSTLHRDNALVEQPYVQYNDNLLPAMAWFYHVGQILKICHFQRAVWLQTQ